MSIFEKAEGVTTHQKFVEFADALLIDLIENRDEWENVTLEHFLESVAAWAKCMDVVYKNAGSTLEKQSPWQLVTDVLLAGRIYE
jgi:hypothetical protein